MKEKEKKDKEDKKMKSKIAEKYVAQLEGDKAVARFNAFTNWAAHVQKVLHEKAIQVLREQQEFQKEREQKNKTAGKTYGSLIGLKQGQAAMQTALLKWRQVAAFMAVERAASALGEGHARRESELLEEVERRTQVLVEFRDRLVGLLAAWRCGELLSEGLRSWKLFTDEGRHRRRQLSRDEAALALLEHKERLEQASRAIWRSRCLRVQERWHFRGLLRSFLLRWHEGVRAGGEARREARRLEAGTKVLNQLGRARLRGLAGRCLVGWRAVGGAPAALEDAVVSLHLWKFSGNEPADPMDPKEWSLREFWLTRSGKIFHEDRDGGRVLFLYDGRSVGLLEIRRLHQNSTCFPFALLIGLKPDDPDPTLLATDEEPTLLGLLRAIGTFQKRRGMDTVESAMRSPRSPQGSPKSGKTLEGAPEHPYQEHRYDETSGSGGGSPGSEVASYPRSGDEEESVSSGRSASPRTPDQRTPLAAPTPPAPQGPHALQDFTRRLSGFSFGALGDSQPAGSAPLQPAGAPLQPAGAPLQPAGAKYYVPALPGMAAGIQPGMFPSQPMIAPPGAGVVYRPG